MSIFGVIFIIVGAIFWAKYCANKTAVSERARHASEFWDEENFRGVSPDDLLVIYPSSIPTIGIMRAEIREYSNRPIAAIEHARWDYLIKWQETDQSIRLTRTAYHEAQLVRDGEIIGKASSEGILFSSGQKIVIEKPLFTVALGVTKAHFSDGEVGYMKVTGKGFGVVALPKERSELEKLCILVIWEAMTTGRNPML